MNGMQFGRIITEEVYRNGAISNRVSTQIVSTIVTSNAQLMDEIVSALELAQPKSTVDLQVVMDEHGKPLRIVKTVKVEGIG